MSGARPVAPPLPIDEALPELLARLVDTNRAVLTAPPGAGKTTRAPLALLGAAWARGGTIVMLEPRRIAARAAAERMAETLGERVGETVGYRIRDESVIGPRTRVEVLTEGVLARRLQRDPELSGVAAVLFDEFHERSLHADLALALCLETQAALRPELRLVVMSATLDVEAVSALLGGAPIVRSEGRMFPVETRWLEAPLGPERAGAPRLPQAAAALALRALAEAEGDALMFLPGAGEIRRAAAALGPDLPPDVDLRPIHGAMPFAEQRAALSPSAAGRRKLVLATAIAETSLTVEGVRIVIDAGRARRARFEPAIGMSRLVTTRVSKAAAEQRRGRAGRLAPGVCYRLWTRGEEGALAAQDPPEMLEADLAPFALELALWGARPEALAFLDPPPEAAFMQATETLRGLGALDAAGRPTAHGRALAAAPLHPRLAHLCLAAGSSEPALRLAALLEDRDPLHGAGADLRERLEAIAAPARRPAARPALERLRETARTLARRLPALGSEPETDAGALVALAFPDRIAKRRAEPAPDGAARFLLASGKGATLPAADPLAAEPFLAVAELAFDPVARAKDPRITLAAPIDRATIERLCGDRIVSEASAAWDKRAERVTARRRLRLGALTLDERPWPDAPGAQLLAAMLEGVRALGLAALPWTPAARRLRARIAAARAGGAALPDVSDAALLERLEAWLGPALEGLSRRDELDRLDLAAVLERSLSRPERQALDAAAPAELVGPTGARRPIDYAEDGPRVAIRIQELYGVGEHPRVAGRPLRLDLLSPADRPIQTTSDLPSFWAGSYADVAKEMRARYPKHDWPADPATAAPGRGPKRRGG